MTKDKLEQYVLINQWVPISLHRFKLSGRCSDLCQVNSECLAGLTSSIKRIISIIYGWGFAVLKLVFFMCYCFGFNDYWVKLKESWNVFTDRIRSVNYATKYLKPYKFCWWLIVQLKIATRILCCCGWFFKNTH